MSTIAEVAPGDAAPAVARAVAYIAGHCDGANSRDGIGFDGQDTHFGKAAATVPAADWTPDMVVEVHRMLRKYRAQLETGGIDYDDLPVPAGASDASRADRRAREQAYSLRRRGNAKAKAGLAPTEAGRIVVDGTGWLHVTFPYDPNAVAAVKNVAGRKWLGDRKVWAVPPTSAPALIAAFPAFTLGDGVAALAADAPTPPPDRRVVVDGAGRWAIHFPYDPALVDAVRAVPGAKWDKPAGCWRCTAGPTAARGVLNLLAVTGQEFTVDLDGVDLADLAGEGDRLAEASRALDADDIPPGIDDRLADLQHTLRPFQRVGVAYMVASRRCFLADEMGGGKTPTTIAAIHAADAYPAYAAVPAKLRTNWAREALKWLPAGTRVAVVLPPSAGRRAQDRLRVKGIIPMVGQPVPGKADVYITGYPLLHTQIDAVAAVAPRSFVIDEGHYCKTRDRKKVCPECGTDMGKANVCKGAEKHVVAARQQVSRYKVLAVYGASAIADTVKAGDGFVWDLTGTPNKNTTSDFVAQLDILGRLDEFGGEWGFLKRFCAAWQDRWGWHTDGTSNEAELNDRLRASCYIRRTKDQFLPELPPIDRHPLYVDLPDQAQAAYDRIEDDFMSFLAERARAIALELGVDDLAADRAAWHARLKAEGAEHLVRISTLRQAAATAKIDLAHEWVDQFLAETDRKLIVFAHHKDVVRALADRFGCDRIDGETTGMTDTIVDRFQSDPSARLLVIGIMAGGVGLTLTAASDMLFLEQAWTPADLDQAEARCYGRLNDAHGATATYMLAAGTFDEDMWSLLEGKRAEFARVANGSHDDAIPAGRGDGLGDFLVAMADRAIARTNASQS